MKKIVHIITGLGSGGAENMLYKLLKYSDEKKFQHEVISLMDKGIYGEKIEKLGIKVQSFNLNKKNIVQSLLTSRAICKDADIINTWLYHADIFGFIIAKILLRKKIIWNIRHSNLDRNANKPRTLKIVKLNALLSKYVDSITYNSNKALSTHLEIGYKNINSVVMPNGFELDKFKFRLDDRKEVRRELNLSNDEKVFITVGRWDIQKDYYTLLKTLNQLYKKNKKFKMLMVGTNLDNTNHELKELINIYDLKENVILLGRQNDIPALLSAADIYISSSLGESFSNSIGEAMACELTCIVTDVGDSKKIVGDAGVVVKSEDYRQLLSQLLNLINVSKLNRNIKARNKILDNYEITDIVRQFENIYKKI